jgi:hypothetical protein
LAVFVEAGGEALERERGARLRGDGKGSRGPDVLEELGEEDGDDGDDLFRVDVRRVGIIYGSGESVACNMIRYMIEVFIVCPVLEEFGALRVSTHPRDVGG